MCYKGNAACEPACRLAHVLPSLCACLQHSRGHGKGHSGVFKQVYARALCTLKATAARREDRTPHLEHFGRGQWQRRPAELICCLSQSPLRPMWSLRHQSRSTAALASLRSQIRMLAQGCHAESASWLLTSQGSASIAHPRRSQQCLPREVERARTKAFLRLSTDFIGNGEAAMCALRDRVLPLCRCSAYHVLL